MASPDLSISTPPTSLVSDKEPPPPTVQFTNFTKLYQVTRQVSGDFLVVQNVSPADFEKLCLQEKRPFRIRRYDNSTGILVITIPTGLHEVLHLELYQKYFIRLVRNNQEDGWKTIGSTTFRPRGHPGGDGGEGDSSGGPRPVRDPKGSWPTLVIESGVSESLSALQDDMRWWFSASDHEVKIVLLAKFDYRNQRIMIEKWEEAIQTRLGAIQPVLRQDITIIRDLATDSYHVTSGALVLSFRLLFLRAPGPQEGDYIISIAELQDYGRRVWSNV
ncbi:hypothetical protein BR93DRAFT_135768 [Coniochaeta sp. PMI_546]|nr:hypothetical protein BR93DRAFT_135768 [Coniochaeta sp. PMI_546]